MSHGTNARVQSSVVLSNFMMVLQVLSLRHFDGLFLLPYCNCRYAGTIAHRLRLWLIFSGFVFISLGSLKAATPKVIETDLLIVGGTESGWAAAIQAARMGVESIDMVLDGAWLGGQFTEQGLACVDENKGVGKEGWGVPWHPMKRSFYRSGLFKEWMDRMESFNEVRYGDRMPGRPFHGPSTFRPAEAESVFREMLQPYCDSGQVRVWLNRFPVKSKVDRSSVRPKLTAICFSAIPLGDRQSELKTQSSLLVPQGTLRSVRGGESIGLMDIEGHPESSDLWIHAKVTIDASDWGEAIQVSGASYQVGPDPQQRFGEPSAPVDLSGFPRYEMNPITWALVVEQNTNALPIKRPKHHDDRNFVRTSNVSLSLMGDLQWDRPVKLGSIPHWPNAGSESARQLSIFNVRRLIDAGRSREKQTVILLNYMLGQDYPLERLPGRVVRALEANEIGASSKNIVEMTREQRRIVFDDAKQHSLSLLYHLQNYVHQRVEDRANSFRGFDLSNEFGTSDRLPPKPYIRESLRLDAMYMMREQDARNRDGTDKRSARERFADVMYPDGIACWQFHYDFHRTGRAYLREEGTDGPWIDYEKPGRHTHHVSDRSVFPLRSLIPREMDGLLGAQKNLGYSSIVCAAIRLHDQGMAIGQAVGATAAIAVSKSVEPRQIPYDRDLLEEIRGGLCRNRFGEVPLLLWPFRDLDPSHRSFVSINRLSALGVRSHREEEVDFRPNQVASRDWKISMLGSASKQLENADALQRFQVKIGSLDLSRGEFCDRLWRELQRQEWNDFQRRSLVDADGDGISDQDDPTLFTSNSEVIWTVRPPLPLPPHQDGVPGEVVSGESKKLNFTTANAPAISGFQNDRGLVYQEGRGFGWSVHHTADARSRGLGKALARDSFAFSRDTATWEHEVENGLWSVSFCMGDAEYDQPGQGLSIEGQVVADSLETRAGEYFEKTVEVNVSDGRLTIDFGPQKAGFNTCLNWVILSRIR